MNDQIKDWLTLAKDASAVVVVALFLYYGAQKDARTADNLGDLALSLGKIAAEVGGVKTELRIMNGGAE